MSSTAIPLQLCLPRLFDDLTATLQQSQPQLLEQLRALQVVARCQCGAPGCASLICESSNPKWAPTHGGRPLSFPIQGVHGWFAVSAQGILSGIEIMDDYQDQSIAYQLQRLGFTSGKPSPAPLSDDEDEGNATSVFMTPDANAHLAAYRKGVQFFSAEDIVEYIAAALRAEAEPSETKVQGISHVSLLSNAMTCPITQRAFRSRLLLQTRNTGFAIRNMVPEGISPQTY